MRELAAKLIKKFHPELHPSAIHDERIMKNLRKSLREDFIKIDASGIVIDEKKLRMWETSDDFGDINKKNQIEYWIDRGVDVPIQFIFGQNELLTALILKNNLKIFQGTELQKDIDSLIGAIDNYVKDNNEEFPADIFENIDTGGHDFTALSEDIAELFDGICNQNICSGKYRGGSEENFTSREFIPIKFILYNNTLYIFVFNIEKNEFRFYNLSRFRPNTLLATKNKFQYEIPQIKWNELKRESFGIVHNGNVMGVKIEFISPAVKYIKGRKWHFDPKISYKKNGNMLMEMNICVTTELISWIMRWMPNVIIHKPDELVAMVKTRLYKSLENNNWKT